MKLDHLVAMRNLIANEFSVTRAAEAMASTQPIVSRQLQALEAELGLQLFYRSRQRLTGLTRAGEAVAEIAERIVKDVRSIEQIASGFSSPDTGDLTIATTHTYARHLLPDVLDLFSKRYPKVRIVLKQGNPQENAQEVSAGDADLFVASVPERSFLEDIALIPLASIPRILMVQEGHMLSRIKRPSLAQIAAHPIITFSSAYSARTRLLEAFNEVGIKPNIVLSATDAEVIKTYVKMGLGVAILSSMSYEPGEAGLVAISVRHLFQDNAVYIGVRRHSFLRDVQSALIALLTPKMSRAEIERIIKADAP